MSTKDFKATEVDALFDERADCFLHDFAYPLARGIVDVVGLSPPPSQVSTGCSWSSKVPVHQASGAACGHVAVRIVVVVLAYTGAAAVVHRTHAVRVIAGLLGLPVLSKAVAA